MERLRNVGGHSVWYSFTPTMTSPIQIDTHVSGFDTLLAVYTGSSVSSLTQVAANDDDASAGGTSSVTFQVQAGTTYHVAVDGKNGATGIYLLNTKYLGTDLSISMNATVASLASIKHVIQVNNAGPGIATNTKVIVYLSAGETLDTTQAGGCAAVGNVVTCPMGTISPYLSASVTFYANATAAANYSTTASVSCDLTELNTANNAVTVLTPFNYNDLSISLYANEVSSTSIVYSINAGNAGPRIATNVKATVTLPSGVTLDLTQAGGCTAVGSVVTCLLGTINPLGNSSATFFANVPVFGTYTAMASVSADLVDLNLGNNSASTPITVIEYVPPAIDDDVPTLPQWGLILMGLILFVSAQFQYRNRKG